MYLYNICAITNDLPGCNYVRASFMYVMDHEISSNEELTKIHDYVIENFSKQLSCKIENIAYESFSLISSSYNPDSDS